MKNEKITKKIEKVYIKKQAGKLDIKLKKIPVKVESSPSKPNVTISKKKVLKKW